MRLKTITAENMKIAMSIVREELGEDAVILSSDEKSSQGVTLTVAVEEVDPWLEEDEDKSVAADDGFSIHDRDIAPPKQDQNGQIKHPNNLPFASRLGERLNELFSFHQIRPDVINELVAKAEELKLRDGEGLDDLQDNCEKLFSKFFRFDPLALRAPGYRYMLVGLPGIGKTLMIAKIAAQLRMKEQDVVVISTDNKRAGGVEQLEAFTRILGIEIEVAESKDELRDILKNCDAEARVLIDSAGCNPYAFSELKELGEYAGLQEIEPILVCPAGIDTGEAEEMANVFSFLDIERMVVSRVDTTRRLGSVLAAAKMGDYALAHVSNSSKVVGDLAPLSPGLLASMLVHYKRERMS